MCPTRWAQAGPCYNIGETRFPHAPPSPQGPGRPGLPRNQTAGGEGAA